MPVALDVTPHPTPGTPQGMGYRLFSRFRIGTRLAAMMVLAATVSALLAAMGIRGLAAANDSLRSVYEERMTPRAQPGANCAPDAFQPIAATGGFGGIESPRGPCTHRPAT